MFGFRRLFFIFSLTLVMSVFSRTSQGAEIFSLALAPDFVQASERPALELFLSDSEALLPPLVKNIISRQITVRFTDRLGSSTAFQTPECGTEPKGADQTQGQIRGRVSAKFFQTESQIDEIQLNVSMKEEILKGPEKSTRYACGHHTLYRLAMATLLHEISHLYDFSSFGTPERAIQQENCKKLSQDLRRKGGLCDRVLGKTRVLSNSPSFMSLVDWDPSTWQRLNFSILRSPDPYEYTSLEEEFAVNMEYFLLDPEYACRRPSEFEYLRDHFGYDPYPNRDCKTPTQVELTNNALGQAAGKRVDLDPARIYQIHYLFASRGPKAMSQWGHAMFRIIVCNPSRKEVGPDCLNDIRDQIVVSYRANPGDWSVSAWDGIAGNYPSRLFLYPLYPDIINQYTVDEFRDLISLPIKLSETEKNRFVERVLEQYWQYKGRYFFFSNNCATEAAHLLKGVIRDPSFQNLDILSPIGLYEALSRRGYIDPKLLANHDRAISGGYLFPSQKTTYEGAFQRLRSASPNGFPYPRFDDYMTRSKAADRLALYRKLRAQNPQNLKNLALRFFILETYLFRNARNQFMKSLVAQVQSDGGMAEKISRLLELSSSALPWNQAVSAYGIPLPEDALATTASSQTIPQVPEVQAIYQELMNWAQENLVGLSAEITAISENQRLFQDESRTR